MADRTKREAREDAAENELLQGTFVSVLFVGGFILALWLAIFLLYLSRQ